MKSNEIKRNIKKRIEFLGKNNDELEIYITIKDTPGDAMKKSMIQQRKMEISSLYWVLDMINNKK